MLRNQISESAASYAEPVLGVHLRDSEENLRDGEARLMQNCEFYGGVRIRRGSQRITPASLGSYRVLGGTKFYYGGSNPQSKRLVAYNNRISVISDTGAETILTSGMTAGFDTYFKTWSIQDSVYVSNSIDTLRKYDGTTFSTVAGTNIPVPRSAVIPVVDRLLCITTNGVERTSPRVDTTWSANSSWATLRPQSPGLFTALHPYTLRGTDTLYSGAIAFQERAHYLITGTDYGTDASAGTASVGEDASIQLLDPIVGTNSPDSVCTVPGIGMFWFTPDLNVYWLPEGTLQGRFVGDKIQSTVSTPGIESTYTGALKQVWMTYFDHMLVLGIPLGTNTYASTQWWMDMRALRNQPDRGPVWYGPMTGQTVGRVWVENQQGDNRLVGGEGNAGTGCYLYQIRVPNRFTDAVGITDTAITMAYQTPFKSFGIPSREKYVQAVHMDLNSFSGTATLDLLDLDGTLASGLPVVAV
jgi:hypothetical protein